MNQDEYAREVLRVLATQTDHAVSQLSAVLQHLPALAKLLTIDLFVDQGGEGFLSVRAGLEGPDLYVLNRSIRAHADLFSTVMTETGLHPALPLMDIDNEEFSVQDVLTDCGAKWASMVWEKVDNTACKVPVIITSPEGYGTLLPLQLRP